jgi:hypothetical protein
VTRRLILPGGLLALEATALVVVVLVAPGRAALAAHVFVLVVAGEALLALSLDLSRSLRPSEPSTFEHGLRRRPQRAERVGQLVRIENEVALGLQTAWDLHVRLVPLLREAAAGLLAARRGVDLAREPERAAPLLGADAWELVRPDRPSPEHRHGPGIDAPALDRALSALERL